MKRRVVKAQEVSIFRKDWRAESSVTCLGEGRLAKNPEGPKVEGLVKDPEVASLLKGPKAASPVKGPEVVIEGHAVESFVKSLAVESLMRNPGVGNPEKGHQTSPVEDQEVIRKKWIGPEWRGIRKG